MSNNKAKIIEMMSVDDYYQQITFQFEDLNLDDNKTYSFNFKINDDTFRLFPFKRDGNKIEFIYTWLYDIDLYIDDLLVGNSLEYQISEENDFNNFKEKVNIIVYTEVKNI